MKEAKALNGAAYSVPKGPGQGALVLRMWAQKKEIKQLIWGGKHWKSLRPTMAQELDACAATMELIAVELLKARALLVAIADNPGAGAIAIKFGDREASIRELVAGTMDGMKAAAMVAQ